MLFPRYVVESRVKSGRRAREFWSPGPWFDREQDAIECAADERGFHPDKEWRVRDTKEQRIVTSTHLDIAA